MKKGRYSEEQIIGVLKQMEAGRTVKDLAREVGVSEATLPQGRTARANQLDIYMPIAREGNLVAVG